MYIATRNAAGRAESTTRGMENWVKGIGNDQEWIEKVAAKPESLENPKACTPGSRQSRGTESLLEVNNKPSFNQSAPKQGDIYVVSTNLKTGS